MYIIEVLKKYLILKSFIVIKILLNLYLKYLQNLILYDKN